MIRLGSLHDYSIKTITRWVLTQFSVFLGVPEVPRADDVLFRNHKNVDSGCWMMIMKCHELLILKSSPSSCQSLPSLKGCHKD